MGNSGDQLPALRASRAFILASVLIGGALSATPAVAADCPIGRYFAQAGPDTASALEIAPDGRFRYMLSEGAVDEAAEGRWRCVDGTLLLTTEPTPHPAEFRLASIEDSKDPGFALRVTWPDGSGIPAIDFQIDFDEGESVTGYTQSNGWSRDLEGRRPKSIRLSEPFFGTASPVFALPERGQIRVTIILTPNDMGIADFRDAPVSREGDRVMLHWGGRSIPYALAQDD